MTIRITLRFIGKCNYSLKSMLVDMFFFIWGRLRTSGNYKSHYSTKIFILIFIIDFQRMGWCTNPEPPKYGCILNDLQWLIIEQKTIHHLNLKNQPSLNIFIHMYLSLSVVSSLCIIVFYLTTPSNLTNMATWPTYWCAHFICLEEILFFKSLH
jgi:hypothetical protein